MSLASVAILTVAPIPVSDADAQMFPDAATLAVSNLVDLLGAIRADDPFDPDVADALSRARRALGPDGCFTIRTR